MRLRWPPFLTVIMGVATAWPLGAAEPNLPLDAIKLPPGFVIDVVARVPNARAMTWGGGGTLFVGSTREGKVYAVKLAADGDPAKADVRTLASGLRNPLGVAYRDGSLYVSAVDRILRFADVDAASGRAGKPVVIYDALPSDSAHGGRFIAFGPDGKLYVAVGAPCNICAPDSDRYANILRMNPDGSGVEVFARGIRNSVGFDWNRQTRELWFTDNGRDQLGDDVPGDELNQAPRAGLHFGYPHCHAGTFADPEFGSGHPCREYTPPARVLGAHVAALGMRFYTGTAFPAEYRDRVFIAEHGSWNRSSKAGYRVTTVKVEGGRAVSYEPFAQGWLQGQDAWGRPADVLVTPEGALLVSDDQAGVIYRIRYRGGGRQ